MSLRLHSRITRDRRPTPAKKTPPVLVSATQKSRQEITSMSSPTTTHNLTGDLITTHPLPFLLMALVTAVVTLLLWRVVLSALLTVSALWTLAAHDGNAVVLAALLMLAFAAALVFQPARGARRPVQMRRTEVTA